MSKFLCDGCRCMFSMAELKLHLGISPSDEAAPKQLNNRGNRATTAPFFNLNDPNLTLSRCPRRQERLGRAGALHADEAAPMSLPLVLPHPMGRNQIEDLKDALLNAFEERRKSKARVTMMKEIQASGKDAVAPSLSSALRPRVGRNLLFDDAVLEMGRVVDAAKKAKLTPGAADPRGVPPPPPPPAPKAPIPSYMLPLNKNRASSAKPVAQPLVGRPRADGAKVHVDPQAVATGRSGQRPNDKGAGGYIRLSNGQVAPIYVKI